MRKIDEFIEILHQNGFKATAHRIEILNILTQTKTHPTAEDMYQKVKEKFPTISPATVYKTIQVLKNARKIQELAFYDSKTRFEANMEPHINLICTKCGKIEDLMDSKIKKFVDQLSNKISVNLEGQRIDFYTTCRECLKKD